jgi:hypothetical protein
MLLFDPSRPRQIVELAASRVKNPSTKSWLRNDERGTWENTAKRYLERVPEILAAKNLQMTDEQIDDEIATMLSVSALEATLANAIKHKKRKKR